MRWTGLGALLAVGAAALLLALQPARAPWWSWADPDGAYVGSSLNIILGNHTNYLDHPGLPTQVALALGFGTEYLVGRSSGSYDDREAFADEKMLELDRTRSLYRAWAIALFLLSTLLVFAVVARLLGGWAWGLAGALLFLSAPGLGAISFLLRPDAALAALCVAVGYLTVRGFDERSAIHYTGAAVVLGFAMTFKLTAIGMLVPFLAAIVWRPPGAAWFHEIVRTIGPWTRRNGLWLVPLALAWIVIAWVLNRERLPIVQTDDQRAILVNGGTFVLAYAAFAFVVERFRIPAADRIFRLAYAWFMVAFVAGLAIPATFVLDDGVQMLVAMRETLTGERVNADIDPFANVTFDSLTAYPLVVMVAVVGLGLVGGILGAFRREYWPTLLALGSIVLATMAAARYSFDYYYAPAYAVAIPGTLWLVRQAVSRRGDVVALAAAVLLFGYSASRVQTWEPDREQEVNAAAQQLADELLRPGEVILVNDYYFPVEDVRFGSLVEGFVDYVPEFPYRFLSAPGVAEERSLTPRYVVGTDEIPEPGEVVNVSVGGRDRAVEGLDRRGGPENSYRVGKLVESPAP